MRATAVRLLVVVLLGTVGCTEADEVPDTTESRAPETGPASGEGSKTGEAGVAPTEQPDAEQPDAEPHPVSIRALIETRYDGGRLRVGEVLGEFGSYTRYAVTYRSEGLRISAIMNVPAGRGPFPVLVLNHGYIDPASYVTGQGLAREQDWLARQGYVVLHTDYRNHAGSDDDPNVDYELRLPYAVDVVTRCERSSARTCRTSTATGLACSAGRWAAT